MTEISRHQVSTNRLDLISRWADDLAHEIKNPLHAMVINLELVKRRASAGEGEMAAERVGVVEEELHRVHELVDSLLKLVRPWPDVRHTDPGHLIQEISPVIRARGRIRQLEWVHRAEGVPVIMGPGAYSQMLLNLVENAMDAMDPGGRLTTVTEAAPGVARLIIADDGAGMSPDVRERAGEPGFTTRDGRSGLGLAVSLRFVREAGGELEVRPRGEGQGTEVVVTLPRADSA